MEKEKSNVKLFTVRVPKDIWVFLKKASIEQEIPMGDIVIECLTKYRKKVENKMLTNIGDLV